MRTHLFRRRSQRSTKKPSTSTASVITSARPPSRPTPLATDTRWLGYTCSGLLKRGRKPACDPLSATASLTGSPQATSSSTAPLAGNKGTRLTLIRLLEHGVHRPAIHGQRRPARTARRQPRPAPQHRRRDRIVVAPGRSSTLAGPPATWRGHALRVKVQWSPLAARRPARIAQRGDWRLSCCAGEPREAAAPGKVVQAVRKVARSRPRRVRKTCSQQRSARVYTFLVCRTGSYLHYR